MGVKGVYSTQQLKTHALGDVEIRALARRGRLISIRKGWWATPEAAPELVRAVRAGGSLTCVSALGAGWAPPARGLHIRLPANSRRVTISRGDVVPHALGRPAGTPRLALDPVPLALACTRQCLGRDEVVAVVDSILRSGEHPDELLQQLLAVDPDHAGFWTKAFSRTSLRSESGSESLLRLGLRSRNIPHRIQAQIGPHRVDILVGDRLVLECDSRAHHTGIERYSADRERDQFLIRHGYQVLRFTYEQVLHRRDEVLGLVQELCRRGEHRWRGRR